MAVTSDGGGGGGAAERVEICDEEGFVFKRRCGAEDKETSVASVAAAAAAAAEALEAPEDGAAEVRRLRRQRKLNCLKSLREKYRKELEKWERLSATVNQISEQVPERPTVDLRLEDVAGSQLVSRLEDRGDAKLVDELLVQVECQEAIFKKIEEICSEVDALCEEKEEKMANSLIELPIWSSPRTLLESLSD